MAQSSPAFTLINPDAGGPVILSVPHAGRDYAPEHLARLRPPPERLRTLEDRLVDQLALGLNSAPLLIARAPRVWIDLNRHEAEIDPGLVEEMTASRLMLTPKVRSGLGLIPRRIAEVGELWRRRLSRADVEARIATVHRPYHAALRRLIEASLARRGVAVLLDLHSMPPLERGGADAVRVVIGNRYGQSAAPWATASLTATCARFGLAAVENTPYAGGFIADRHGSPRTGVHALQLEVDRSLYLDSSLEQVDPAKLVRAQAFVRAAVTDLARAALDSVAPLAAE
jgi:N-formylglutamate amidohydrolase